MKACKYNAIKGIVLFDQTYSLSHSLKSKLTALLYLNTDTVVRKCDKQLLESSRKVYFLITRLDTVGVAHVSRESALTVYRKVLTLTCQNGILGGIVIAEVYALGYQIGIIPLGCKPCDVRRRIEKLIVQKYNLEFRDANIRKADTWDEFMDILDNKSGFVYAHWDGTTETEEKIKEMAKATIRCIPFNNPLEDGKCILTGKPSKQRVVFARAY